MFKKGQKVTITTHCSYTVINAKTLNSDNIKRTYKDVYVYADHKDYVDINYDKELTGVFVRIPKAIIVG